MIAFVPIFELALPKFSLTPRAEQESYRCMLTLYAHDSTFGSPPQTNPIMRRPPKTMRAPGHFSGGCERIFAPLPMHSKQLSKAKESIGAVSCNVAVARP